MRFFGGAYCIFKGVLQVGWGLLEGCCIVYLGRGGGYCIFCGIFLMVLFCCLQIEISDFLEVVFFCNFLRFLLKTGFKNWVLVVRNCCFEWFCDVLVWICYWFNVLFCSVLDFVFCTKRVCVVLIWNDFWKICFKICFFIVVIWRKSCYFAV